MKRIMLLLAATALVFVGCDWFGAGDEEEVADTTEESAVIYTVTCDGTKVKDSAGTTTYAYLYVNLEDPETPLASGGNTEWDLMITAAKEILTNSGVTATSLSSGGTGGVAFSGYTDFTTEMTAAEAQALIDADARDGCDYSYWDKYKSTSTAAQQTGNAISFPGYPIVHDTDGTTILRDGATSGTAWVFNTDVDFSKGTAYATWERMTPNFSAFTNNVYVVRSGDGSSYYRVQVLAAEYLTESDVPGTGDTTTHYTFQVKTQRLL